MKKFFYLFAFSCLLMSCSSSDDSNSNNNNQDDDPQEILLLKNVFKDGSLERHFEYFDDNKLKKEIRYTSGNPVEIIHEYIEDTIFERLYLFDEVAYLQKKFVINQNQSRSDYYDYINEIHNYRIFEFDNNGCGVNNFELYNSEGIIQEKINYNYYNENCSYEATFEFSDYSTGQRVYDNKNGYDTSISSIIFRKEIHHNTIENRLWDINNVIAPSYSYNSVFDYNDENYPIMETRTYLNGYIIVYTFEYY